MTKTARLLRPRRRRPLALAALGALLLPVAARADDRLEVKLRWRAPSENARVALRANRAQKFSLDVSMEGQTVHSERQDEGYRFVMTQLVTGVADGRITEEKRAFAEATRAEGGEPRPLGLQGRTVVMRREADGERDFTYQDGSAIESRDREAIEAAFGRGDEEDHVFEPGRAVAVGDSWKPDLERVARSFFGNDVPEGEPLPIDLEKATGKLTLVRAEARDGATYGVIEGEIVLPLDALGPLQLGEPVPCRFVIRYEGCIDGTRPDAEISVAVAMKAERAIEGPGGEPLKIDLDMDVRFDAKALLDRPGPGAGAGAGAAPAPEKKKLY